MTIVHQPKTPAKLKKPGYGHMTPEQLRKLEKMLDELALKSNIPSNTTFH